MLREPISPKELLCIPNMLSMLRLALLPFVLYYYLKGEVKVAGLLLILSALTDVADGFFARRLNQITNLGKMLDPIADKLTQIFVAAGLCLTYTALIPLTLVLAIKELLMGWMGLTLLKRGKQPFSARWWGKVATATFYVAVIAIMMFGHTFSRGSIWAISLTVALLLAHSLFRYYDMLKHQLQRS